ncbi:hypothetical protein R6Q59_004483 [Mikania micrantha]
MIHLTVIAPQLYPQDQSRINIGLGIEAQLGHGTGQQGCGIPCYWSSSKLKKYPETWCLWLDPEKKVPTIMNLNPSSSIVTMEVANVTLLQELDVLNDNYTLKVCITRIWKQPLFSDPTQTYSMEMILVDEMGTKVQATVQNKWVPKFSNMLKEFECIFIQKPTLAQNRSKLKYAHYPSKVSFTYNTKLSKCTNFGGPKYGFDFATFESIQSQILPENITIDVIGYVVKCYNLEKCTNVQTGLESQRMNIQIEDLDYLAKMSTETSSSYRSIGSSIVTSIEDEFLEKIEFSTIADISGIVEVKSLIVVGTVKGVCKDISWYYNACSNCSRKVKIEFNDAEDKKIKIPIRVQDYTGVVSLTLFDREALKLLHISAQDLLEMTLQDSTNDMIPQHFNGFMDKKICIQN